MRLLCCSIMLEIGRLQAFVCLTFVPTGYDVVGVGAFGADAIQLDSLWSVSGFVDTGRDRARTLSLGWSVRPFRRRAGRLWHQEQYRGGSLSFQSSHSAAKRRSDPTMPPPRALWVHQATVAANISPIYDTPDSRDERRGVSPPYRRIAAAPAVGGVMVHHRSNAPGRHSKRVADVRAS